MKCEYCGAEFEARKSNQKYCSARCNWQAYSERHRGAPVIRKCEYCGEEFETRKSNQKYCSARCRKKANYWRHREAILMYHKVWRIKRAMK